MPSFETSKELIHSYLQNTRLVQTQLSSYNDFIRNRLSSIINEENNLKFPTDENNYYNVKFTNIFIDKPIVVMEDRTIKPLTPNEARLRELTYESSICVDIIIEQNDKEIELIRRHPLVNIPVMVNSILCNNYNIHVDNIECKHDLGGYFIINGKERVLLPQERGNYNFVFAHCKNKQYWVDVRSMSRETGHSVYFAMTWTDDDVMVSIPSIDKKIPLGIFLKAFGKEELIENAVNNFRYSQVYDNYHSFTDEEACIYIFSKCNYNIDPENNINYIKQLLYHELLPHMSCYDIQNKIQFILYMIRKLEHTVDGKRPVDDRDNLTNKRLESAGVLVSELFRISYKNFIRKGSNEIKNNIVNFIYKNNGIIIRDLKKSFSTGHWGNHRNAYSRTGVSQILSRLSYTATISHLRRIMIPITKEGKNVAIRQLHPSHTFFICLCESPEGQTVGIVKNLALSCEITNYVNQYPIINILKKECKDIISLDLNHTCVFFNGELIFSTFNPLKFVNTFRDFRDSNIFDKSTSIRWSKTDDEIQIQSDEGRCFRPVLNLKNKHLLDIKDFNKSVDNNSIIYLDAGELETSIIAMTDKDITLETQYLEIHPCLMLGFMSSLIPFPANNQAPRNVYYASMAKQAIGLSITNFNQRFDSDSTHILASPQIPLSSTIVGSSIGQSKNLNGVNCIVAIMCFTGFNVEDSIIISKSAIDKGLFTSIKYKTISTTLGKNKNVVCIPPKDIQKIGNNYNNLLPSGLPKKGVEYKMGDVLLGKTSIVNGIVKDCSIIVGANEEGFLDSIVETKNGDNYRFLKFRLKRIYIPELGDKLCSRSAQKSTIGLIVPMEDMPFMANGMIPDLILNPHSMPSKLFCW
jgi:DNA-directed RNA polymerase II subunit RPB2